MIPYPDRELIQRNSLVIIISVVSSTNIDITEKVGNLRNTFNWV